MTQHITARELPVSERPYEKCLLSGPQALSDAELLAVILKSGSRKMNVVALAQSILQADGKNLLNLYHMSVEELMHFPGIGKVKAIQLLCIGELSRRIWKKKAIARPLIFHDPGQVAEYYREDMRHMEQEQFRMMMFNTRQVLIGDVLLAKGTVSSAVTTPREIFVEALRHQAVSLILVHNHPSGDPEPSKEDIELTARVRAAGKVIGMPLLDHIIIGDTSYVSLKERGL